MIKSTSKTNEFYVFNALILQTVQSNCHFVTNLILMMQEFSKYFSADYGLGEEVITLCLFQV